MRRYIDLHMHTNYSDGFKTPSELLEIVRKSKVEVFSVTDHDTVDGFLAVQKLMTDNDPILISGLELSTTHEEKDIHILAYLFDPHYPELLEALNDFQEYRNNRGQEIVRKLNEMGIPITYDDVEKQSQGAVVGRPHIARAMHASGELNYYEEAFEKYIGSNGPAYVPKKNMSPKEAIALIHRAGGVAVLAHPVIDDNERFIELLMGWGLDGIECYHSSHKQPQVDRLLHTAERFRLIPTGGSDFHGFQNRHGSVGSQKVPYRLYEQLMAQAKK